MSDIFEENDILEFGNDLQITGVLYSGKDKNLLCVLPNEVEDITGLDVYSDMTTEEWKALFKQTDLVETEVLAKAADGKLVKAILRKTARQVDQRVSWNVFRRDNYSCRYCGANEIPLTVDHLVLWEVGGPSIEENLVSSCRKCNRTRGNMEYSDWLKDSYYLKVSKDLPDHIKMLNADVSSILASIPRRVHKQKR